jgi:hypothetical protein
VERFAAVVFQKLKHLAHRVPRDRPLGSAGKSGHRAAGFERGFRDGSVVAPKRPVQDRRRHAELLGRLPDREALGTKFDGAFEIHDRSGTVDMLALPARTLLASSTPGSDLPSLFLDPVDS